MNTTNTAGLDLVSQQVLAASEQALAASEAPKTDDEWVAHLAALPPLERERQTKVAAKELGVKAATLEKLVRSVSQGNAEEGGIALKDVKPWDAPVDPATLLNEIVDTIQRFIVCPPETAQAAALWCAMTWFMDVVNIAPLAVITAPEKRCGKTQLLNLMGRLVYRPIPASNITAAALFRTIEAWSPTLMIDEADSFMKDNEELRGVVNCGHSRDGAFVIRTVGDDHTPRQFSVWGAKAISGIGMLAETLTDRAVLLKLRRKLPQESAERLRHAEPDLFRTLAAKLARLAVDHKGAVGKARPDLPASLNDRAQDNWEPLLAIADLAGKEWGALAREAALLLSSDDDGETEGSVGVELLRDIHAYFAETRAERIGSVDLIEHLCKDDERPWATYNRGKAISPRQVGKNLKGYGIASKDFRFSYGGGVKKGYEAGQFKEAFNRYVACQEPAAEAGQEPAPQPAKKEGRVSI